MLNWMIVSLRRQGSLHNAKMLMHNLVSIVSRYSVWIVSMSEDLNGLDVKCADAKIAYFNANTKEKVWF